MLGVEERDKKNIVIYYMEIRLNNVLSKRFLTGLNKYELNYEDIKNNWYYIGGESGQHLNYFKRNYKNDILPDHNGNCICGHKIKNNCFISDGEFVLSIGESCINKFIPKNEKICSTCGIRHRNRKDNNCVKCRKKFRLIKKECVITFN